ncbi:MAG: transglycosylase domain-containing protein [Selenomonadaceae bacterium]|nr:transglycosylase domain-containing protein [Selenomonadaceae bacterium]
MKRNARRRGFRPLRFLAFLFLVFSCTFLLAGGGNIFLPRTWQGIGDFLPKLERQLPSGYQTSDAPISNVDRLSRLVFLRRAVNSRIEKDGYVTIDKIPQNLKDAVVAVEDRRFYEHHGFDVTGVARASLVNLQYGEIEEGASTITQQLVKNLFLSHERTFGRKVEELLLSLDMEANYSKDEILELYLNTIYYGSGYYGIGAAADGFFGKAPKDLALPEAAMLAGLPNAPSVYSPYEDFMMAKKRQFVVLDAMVSAGYITEELAEDAKIKPITLARTRE